MKQNKKNIDSIKNRISLEARNEFVKKSQKFFSDEFDVDLGEFEAEEIFDMFCEKCGKIFYNAGLEDAKSFFMKRFTECTEDIVQLNIPE